MKGKERSGCLRSKVSGSFGVGVAYSVVIPMRELGFLVCGSTKEVAFQLAVDLRLGQAGQDRF